ncbi:hypothetical protein CABS01_14018 [Colletotrichum abscissum]|uniref:uncharacterized protein n=1 Tax=Colletotrichum abscissum TaxID=1671311 RepID=UPI0027D544F4|nr:uncharacterized protein CABS01_14018 [Colletotrichum abscissum]KAK1482320.1 hypothetical protein CABS01_14018 [Colletotrichum abscissum]
MFWRLVRKTVTAPCLQMLCSCFAGVRPVQHGNAKTTNFNTPQGNLKSQVRLPLLLSLSSVVYTSALSCSPARAGHGGLMSPACVRIRPPPPRRTQGTLSCQWDCRRGSYLPCGVAPAHRRVLIFPQLSASVLQSGWLQYTRRALASNGPKYQGATKQMLITHFTVLSPTPFSHNGAIISRGSLRKPHIVFPVDDCAYAFAAGAVTT